jgi:4-amino-4-deoxy-L-arabinose transferase-like glycosyltransferase
MGDIPEENLTQRDSGLFTFLLAGSCFLFINLERRYRWWKLVLLGLLMGLICLVRPVAAIGPFFAGMWAWRLSLKQLEPAEIGLRLALFLASFYLVLLPWGVRNWLAVKQFTITSTTGGLNLWKGNNPGTADFYPFLDVDILDELLQEPPQEPGWWDNLRSVSTMNEVEQDAYLRRVALDYIVAYPDRFLRLGVLKVYTLWLPQLTPLGKGDIEWTPTGAEIKDYEIHYYPIAPYLILYFLTALDLWRLRGTSLSWFFLVWIIFLSLLHFITFGESRFRWPINTLSLPIAAIGLDLLIASRYRLLELWRTAPEE